jgi:hypothetical protein
MKRSLAPFATTLVLIIMTAGTGLYADTLQLFEGTILVGKIIEDEGKTILFANSYGTFRIKKTKLDNTFVTSSYAEDIALHRKNNFPVDEAEIMRNYKAGQDRKEGKKIEPIKEDAIKPEPEKKTETDRAEPLIAPVKKDDTGDKWTSGRISVSGSFIYNLGSGNAAMPYGYGGNVALDQGLDFIAGGRHPAMFGLRFEGGYVYFKKGSLRITGFTTGAGLMWALPSMKNSWGCFVLALVPGVSFLRADLSSGPFSFGGAGAQDYTFMGQAIFGYQKSWGVFSLFVQARYLYMMQPGDDLMSIAGEAGFGFNAW